MRRWLVLALTLTPLVAQPADAPLQLSEGRGFVQQDGASLYRAICQGCHMADGQGATGAGAYPALASNPRLASAPYVMITVLRGRKGMPGFGDLLSDEQVAELTRYVRRNLGNQFPGDVSAADAKALRSADAYPRRPGDPR